MPAKVLHLDSSILSENSVSRSLSASVIARLKQSDPEIDVTYRDLAATPIQHLSGLYLAAAQGMEWASSPEIQADVAVGSHVLDEFLAADVIVIGLGFYNFGIPSQLKSWIDRIVIAGKTFRYDEMGRPEGLVKGKRVILAIARGGLYGAGTPAESLEHAETYLRGVFQFLGIAEIEVVIAEGLAAGPDARQAGISVAEKKIAMLV